VELLNKPFSERELRAMFRRGDANVGIVIAPDVERRIADGNRAAMQIVVDGSQPALENVAVPLREHTNVSKRLIEELALLKIASTGFPMASVGKFPNELSGGMRRRAALARAMALDPELLFLDEPTSGLDPLSAAGFDELIEQLREWFQLTIVIITHDLDSLWRIADRVAVLGNGKVLGTGTMSELSHSADPLIHEYFYGPRGRAAREQAWSRK